MPRLDCGYSKDQKSLRLSHRSCSNIVASCNSYFISCYKLQFILQFMLQVAIHIAIHVASCNSYCNACCEFIFELFATMFG